MYALMQDCEKTLDPEITDLFEREANVFASEALFQGESRRAGARREFGIKTAMAIAKQFGASNYATFRRYVITNHARAASWSWSRRWWSPVEVSGPTWRVIASKSFAKMFDPAKWRFP